MSDPKRHHYVPKFYLGYFTEAGSNGTDVLWIYDKERSEPRAQTPVNTCVESGFYSFETATGKDVEIEKGLSQIESETKRILDRLQDPKAPLTAEDISTLSAFLALMHVRVPRSKQVVSEIIAGLATQFAKGYAKDPNGIARYFRETKDRDHKITEQEMIKLLSEFDQHFTIEVDSKAALLHSFTIFPKVAEIFLGMNWCLCRAPANKHFLTSDSPVCVFFRPAPGQAAFGAGLMHSNAEVTFPISPRLVLLLSWHRKQKRGSVSTGFVQEVNRRMAWSAERFVISPLRSRSTAELVREASTTRNQPKMDPERLKQDMERHWEKWRQ